MTQRRGQDNRDTVNAGPAPRRDNSDEFKIGGNVRTRGEDPSPDDRARGERTSADEGSPVDLDRL